MLLKEKLRDKKILLASQSPRRQQLLTELGIPFELRVNSVEDETYPEDLPYNEIPEYLAKKKAEPLLKNLRSNEILITSDTIVWCNGRLIGKPVDRKDAILILNELSDNKHVVVTGICLSSNIKTHLFSSITDVYFRKLSMEEIEYYVDLYKPFDKAGAYGIQEWIGYVAVERIDGSFYNVMGLPLQKLYKELLDFVGD
jgi:septum formation protein